MLGTLAGWTRRRRWAVLGAATATVLVIGIPTDLIPNPVFGRDVPVTWWSWPVLLATAILGGLLTYFAVGCPVCNKIALLLLGYAGALEWFAPVQPYLGVLALVLLAWALRERLAGERACPMPGRSASRSSGTR